MEAVCDRLPLLLTGAEVGRRASGPEGILSIPHQKAHSPMPTPEAPAPPTLLLRLPLLAEDAILTDRYEPTRAPAPASPAASLLP
jgi:hypothetical protein